MDMQAYLTANTQNLSDKEKTALGIINPVQPIVQNEGIVSKSYSVNELYEMKNPATGQRYNVPFLSPADPEYKTKYASVMRVKVSDSELFEKILRGD